MEQEIIDFMKLVDEENNREGIQTKDKLVNGEWLPEGEDWSILLKNGKQYIVPKSSFQPINDDINFCWIEYREGNGVILDINYKLGKIKSKVIISNDEITNVINLG